jgi:hypothetical protein
LAVDVDGTSGDTNATISLDFCAGGALATGIQGALHVMVWYKPTDGGTAPSGPGYTYISDGSGTTVSSTDYNTPASQWFDIPTFNVSGASIKHVDVTISGIDGHKGTLYFDNIHFD